MSAIAEVVANIVAADLPVLFIDTCNIVDVIRAPMRGEKLDRCIGAGQELLRLISVLPVQCTLIVASPVPDEWKTHAPAETDNLRKSLAQFDLDSARLHAACGLVGIAPTFAITEYGRTRLADALHDLSSRLLDSASRIDPDEMCNRRAFERACKYVPPSRKGGEVKDSVIVEEYLEVCRQLQSSGFSRKRVFCTSNTKDYCDSSKVLHANLDGEFTAVGLSFTSSLHWSVHEIATPRKS